MSHINELKELIAKWEAEEKPEEKPYIEPCPICGGEMKDWEGYLLHVGENCGYGWPGSIKDYNIIARVLRTAIEFTNGFCPEIFSAVLDLEALRTKVREGME